MPLEGTMPAEGDLPENVRETTRPAGRRPAKTASRGARTAAVRADSMRVATVASRPKRSASKAASPAVDHAPAEVSASTRTSRGFDSLCDS